jgi:hypothetical protein
MVTWWRSRNCLIALGRKYICALSGLITFKKQDIGSAPESGGSLLLASSLIRKVEDDCGSLLSCNNRGGHPSKHYHVEYDGWDITQRATGKN